MKSQGQRPDSVPWEAGSELRGSLPCHRSCPRRDLCTGTDGGMSATKNLAHFKSMKILRIIWKNVPRVVLLKMRLQKTSGIK
ncbi:hypothetical protein BHM03_00013510 [Ensete ventricosum]|nr:hypothetical protein BHM03_00013510 [Ensete ventricosum]